MASDLESGHSEPARRRLRFLKIRAEGEDRFGPHAAAFRCESPEAGRYRISIKALRGPGQAIVRIYRNEKAVGEAVDLYAPRATPSGSVEIAEMEMEEGENVLLFKLTGRNARSSGLGFDLAEIGFERIATGVAASL